MSEEEGVDWGRGCDTGEGRGLFDFGRIMRHC